MNVIFDADADPSAPNQLRLSIGPRPGQAECTRLRIHDEGGSTESLFIDLTDDDAKQLAIHLIDRTMNRPQNDAVRLSVVPIPQLVRELNRRLAAP